MMQAVKRLGLVLIVSGLFGCATMEQQRAATTGAMIGATAGAMIGAENGQAAEGAMIGGAIGALAGAILAENNTVQSAGPGYHRRACAGGASFFDRARRARSLDRQIALMRQGLSYCPGNPAAHNDLGVALLVRGAPGDMREARMHFRRALEIDPSYLPARRNLQRVRGLRDRRNRYQRPERREQHEGWMRAGDEYDSHEEDD